MGNILTGEALAITQYITNKKLFEYLKGKIEEASIAVDHLESDRESDIDFQNVKQAIKEVEDYVSRYQAAKADDSTKVTRKITNLENKIYELEKEVEQRDKIIEQMQNQFNEEVESRTQELRNEDYMAQVFEQIVEKLDSLVGIKNTVDDIEGISEYVKRLNKGKQKGNKTDKEAVAFKDTVSTDALVKDYESEGYKVTKALIEKYKGRLTKQGIIERLKSAEVYRGREQNGSK